jgi:parvulin-like peptidyl-prolyl isomerase
MSGGLSREVGTAVLYLILLSALTAPAAADDPLATVNGRPITPADLHLEALLRHIPDDQLAARRDELLDDLIDQQLVAAFVARRRTRANPVLLESQLERIEALIRRRGEEPEAFLQRLGIDRDLLRRRLELSLAWRAYVEQVTSDQQLRESFQKHRRQLDGTQLKARHIFIKAQPQDAAAREAARRQLASLREQIAAGEMTFEAAAAAHSQAPSADEGGDVGYFGFRGTMPADFADAAFALQVGEISNPVESPLGVHLIEVTDERPGQLSLEDVRPQIIERISQDLWKARIAQDRPQARIERRS